MTENAPQHRSIDQSIEELRLHIQYKLDVLPEQAAFFHLSEKTIEGLKKNLLAELDQLTNLSSDMTLGDAINNHFTQQDIRTGIFKEDTE